MITELEVRLTGNGRVRGTFLFPVGQYWWMRMAGVTGAYTGVETIMAFWFEVEF